jgi:hypothetical protein
VTLDAALAGSGPDWKGKSSRRGTAEDATSYQSSQRNAERAIKTPDGPTRAKAELRLSETQDSGSSRRTARGEAQRQPREPRREGRVGWLHVS